VVSFSLPYRRTPLYAKCLPFCKSFLAATALKPGEPRAHGHPGRLSSRRARSSSVRHSGALNSSSRREPSVRAKSPQKDAQKGAQRSSQRQEKSRRKKRSKGLLVDESIKTRSKVSEGAKRSYVPRAQFGNDDVGNAERLVKHCGDRFRYVPTWGEFLTWKGTHWKKDVESLAIMALMKDVASRIKQEAKDLGNDKNTAKRKKAIHAWAIQSRSKSRLEAAISLAKSESGVCVDIDHLDKNTWLFNCKSGTIDLKTGRCQDHRQGDLLTKISPVRFDENAKAPRWEKWLEQILPSPEVRDYLQRFIGYCLTGEVSERQFVILFGGGRNGKSLLINVLRYVLGPYCGPMAPGLLMARDNEAHPAEVADLFGLRLATSSETKQGRAFDEEQLKRMTGNEELKARLMRENWWSFFPTHKLLMAVNHKPRVKDVTESFWDRAALVPFNVRIAKDKVDKDLFQKLKVEGPGLLAWMVRGCLEWQKRGLDMPAEVRQATDDYRESEDILGRFLKERLSFGKGTTTIATKSGERKEVKFEVTTQDIFRTLKNWCGRLNLFVPGERAIAERLLSGGAVRAKHIGSENSRGWLGVRILDLHEDPEHLRRGTMGTLGTRSGLHAYGPDSSDKSNIIDFKSRKSGVSGTSDPHERKPEQVPEVPEPPLDKKPVALAQKKAPLSRRKRRVSSGGVRSRGRQPKKFS
jgi:P4 family phage/plasmid primase-like protien